MKRLPQENEPPLLPERAAPSEINRMVKTGVLSLLLHLVLAVFLIFNSMSTFTWGGHKIYRVTLRPFSPPGDGMPSGGSGSGLPRAREALSEPAKIERPKSDEGSKGSEVREGPKPDRRKIERAEKEEVSRTTKKQKKQEPSRETQVVEGLKKTGKKVETVEREKESGKSLQEAMEDIRKKTALDEIQKRVARRSGGEKGVAEGPSSQGPVFSSGRGPSTGSPGSGTGKGTGLGSGTGTGTGTGTGSGSGGSLWGSPGFESKLNDYYSLIWAKIKEGWTIPEDLPKGKTDLEAIIVILIDKGGKLQKVWFEKKSGHTLYDQMAMRAIKKAEPFPPIPKELGEEAFEVGIRFHPD
jgi:TonB family protein